jgi:plastocyanin
MFKDKQGIIATGAALATFAASAALSPAPAEVVRSSEGSPRPVNISLTSFNLAPDALHLKAGQPILLRVANDSGMGHDLTAPEFFRAASIRQVDAARIVGGKVAVGPHQNVIIAMIPTAGRYSMKCSHTLHKMLGMSGTIVVDQ